MPRRSEVLTLLLSLAILAGGEHRVGATIWSPPIDVGASDDSGEKSRRGMDYMHARYYRPGLGRFLSVDKALGRPRRPQSWNRYAYAEGNPLLLVDPDGLEGIHYQSAADQNYYEARVQRNSQMAAVLGAFGPGSNRDLFINRDNPGTHPTTGKQLDGNTEVFVRPTVPSDAAFAAAFKQGGEEAVVALSDSAPDEIGSVTITLSPKASEQTMLHEPGHVAQALSDLPGYEADAAKSGAAKTDADYKKSDSEKKAEAWAKAARKNDLPPPQ